MDFKEMQVNGVTVKFPVWNMRKQLDNQSVIFPIISRPISNAVAMWDGDEESTDEDESYFMAAVIKGVMDSLAECDMNEVAPKLLSDVAYYDPSSGTPKQLTVDAIDKGEAPFNLGHLYTIFAAIVKVNYGPLFDSGLQDSMSQIMNL